MSDLSELYQELILDHNRRPRNFGDLPGADRTAHGHNPLCGDRWSVALCVDDGVIRDVRFTGAGCAISKASASLMTEAVKGLPVAEALDLFDRFQSMLTSPAAVDDQELATVGKLSVFAGVSQFPTRVKCASLAWHTLRSALLEQDAVARTE